MSRKEIWFFAICAAVSRCRTASSGLSEWVQCRGADRTTHCCPTHIGNEPLPFLHTVKLTPVAIRFGATCYSICGFRSAGGSTSGITPCSTATLSYDPIRGWGVFASCPLCLLCGIYIYTHATRSSIRLILQEAYLYTRVWCIPTWLIRRALCALCQ